MRLIKFLLTKIVSKHRRDLMICSQVFTSYKPSQNLEILNLPSISIPPKPSMKPEMLTKSLQTELPGSKIYPNHFLKPLVTQVPTADVPLDDYGTPEYHKREIERQANVIKTLEMIEKALSF